MITRCHGCSTSLLEDDLHIMPRNSQGAYYCSAICYERHEKRAYVKPMSDNERRVFMHELERGTLNTGAARAKFRQKVRAHAIRDGLEEEETNDNSDSEVL